MLSALLITMGVTIPLEYLLLDGKFGHNAAVQMTRQLGLHLVSKLRYDSALYLPYQGTNSRRKYGDQLNPRSMPQQFLCHTTMEEDWRLDYYQLQVLHKEFAQSLNVVIVLKTNLKTQQQGHIILFSSDLELTYHQLIDLYSLRFQIEFDFRDALAILGFGGFYEYLSNRCYQCRQSSFLYGQSLSSPLTGLSTRPPPTVQSSGLEGLLSSLQIC